MANDSVITQQKLKEYHETYVYPFLNGISTKGDQAFVPCGKIEGFMRTTAPKGYLVCDGTEYLKSAYPSLAALLASVDTAQSTTNFAGSDSDHFKVPDLRGEFLRGTGTNSHSNQGSGASVGSHQDATEHTNALVWAETNLIVPVIRNGSSFNTNISNTDNFTNRIANVSTSATLGGGSSSAEADCGNFTSRPTNTSVLYCIAYQDLYLTPGHTYSTDEQVVGTWIGGKPLYEKTFVEVLSEQWSVGSHLISAPILNYERCHKCQAMYQGPVSGSIAIPFGNSNSEYGAVYIGAIDGTNIQVRVGGSQYLPSGATVEVTIQYTKTTD